MDPWTHRHGMCPITGSHYNLLMHYVILMHLNMADRRTDLGGSLGKLLEKSPTGTFGRDQKWGRERFSQVVHNHLHIISVSSSNGTRAIGRQDLKMSLSFRKMSYQSNTSIFVSCIVQILQSFLTTGPWSVSSQMTQFMVGGLEQPTSTGIFCILSASGLLKIRLGVVWLGTRPSTFYLQPWHISLLLLSSLFPI